MGGGIEFIDDRAPKIAVAAASALGLARTVKAHGGTVTLKVCVRSNVADLTVGS